MASTRTTRLIVCERTGRWAAALRMELAEAGVRVWETRSLAECWETLSAAPGNFVVVELDAATADDLLGRMAGLAHRFPRTRVAVVAARSLAEYEWLLREAGAVHFTCSLRQLAPLAQAACRHLGQVPTPRQGLAERIWAGLPWSG